MSVTVAVHQFSAGLDKDLNRKQAGEAVLASAAAGAELVVLPENSMYADPLRTDTDTSYPEPLDGPFVTALAENARSAGVTVVAGMTQTIPGEPRSSNTLVALGPDGTLAGVYRKVHLYDAFGYRESDTVKPAEIVPPLTFSLGGITFGAMTCYDLRFPEMAWTLSDAGATALVLPAAWMAGPAKEDHWLALLRALLRDREHVLRAGGGADRAALHRAERDHRSHGHAGRLRR